MHPILDGDAQVHLAVHDHSLPGTHPAPSTTNHPTPVAPHHPTSPERYIDYFSYPNAVPGRVATSPPVPFSRTPWSDYLSHKLQHSHSHNLHSLSSASIPQQADSLHTPSVAVTDSTNPSKPHNRIARIEPRSGAGSHKDAPGPTRPRRVGLLGISISSSSSLDSLSYDDHASDASSRQARKRARTGTSQRSARSGAPHSAFADPLHPSPHSQRVSSGASSPGLGATDDCSRRAATLLSESE